jgi:hypothetical protein
LRSRQVTRNSRDEDSSLPGIGPAIWSANALLFDIVNGFFNRCRGDMCGSVAGRKTVQATHMALLKYQAEIIIHIVNHGGTSRVVDVRFTLRLPSVVIGGVDSQA